jgi:hypothetical protein
MRSEEACKLGRNRQRDTMFSGIQQMANPEKQFFVQMREVLSQRKGAFYRFPKK